jgi:uncharacterized membrane protein YjgN (DUF898 family)
MNDVSMSAMPQVSPVQFAGRPGFIRLLFKNALLSVVTFGFYRFWARTSVRRYLWNNVVVGGEPLEYAGRGIELFIGFLIAMAIIAPLAAVYGVIQYLMLISPLWAVSAQLIYFAVIGVLIQVAVFRARRYRLSRTQWRGIRCWQDGSSWRYVGISLLYGLLTLVTLGLAAPWMNTALQRYKIEHTIFGNRRFSFTGSGSGLIGRWLVVYVLGALPLIVFFTLNAGTWLEMATAVGGGEIDEEEFRELATEIRGWWILSFAYLFGIVAWLWYRVSEFRYFVAHTEFGAVRLTSAAKLRRFILIFLGYAASMIGLMIAVAVIASLIFAASFFATVGTGAEIKTALANPLFWVEGAFIFATFLLANYVLAQYFMTYRIARHIVSTMTVTNLASVESVVQSTQARPGYGEGLADAFDIGAI